MCKVLFFAVVHGIFRDQCFRPCVVGKKRLDSFPLRFDRKSLEDASGSKRDSFYANPLLGDRSMVAACVPGYLPLRRMCCGMGLVPQGRPFLVYGRHIPEKGSPPSGLAVHGRHARLLMGQHGRYPRQERAMHSRGLPRLWQFVLEQSAERLLLRGGT